MKAAKQQTLRLKSSTLIDPEDDRTFDLGIYDVLLPCRRFTVAHKVAEVGRVSLTAEFLLRLLKSAEGMKEEDVAAFFGYDRREMAFVLSEVETNDFVVRKDGRVYLTTIGQGLFRDGSEFPEIFEVEGRSETVGFDLISLAPEDYRPLDPFELQLPELRASDAGKVSAATRQIPQAFSRFFTEISVRRDPAAANKRSLYSVDGVTAKGRFSSTLRIPVQSTGLRPSIAEPDLSAWRSEYEREDRRDVVEAASRFIDELKVHRRPDDAVAYEILLGMAPHFLKDFARRDGLAVERYYREAFTRAGDIRLDRPTVPLLGSVLTRENARRLFEAAEYGLRSGPAPQLCVWIPPQTPHWGATTALRETLDQIKARVLARQNDESLQSDRKTIGLVAGRAPKHISTAFDVVGTSSAPRIPPSLELLIIPDVLVAVSANIPIGLQHGVPVPLGFVSFDDEVVASVQTFISDRIVDYEVSADVCEHIRANLMAQK